MTDRVKITKEMLDVLKKSEDVTIRNNNVECYPIGRYSAKTGFPTNPIIIALNARGKGVWVAESDLWRTVTSFLKVGDVCIFVWSKSGADSTVIKEAGLYGDTLRLEILRECRETLLKYEFFLAQEVGRMEYNEIRMCGGKYSD